MSSDLVKWLRRGAQRRNLITLGGLQHDQRCLEAADRIEALEAQLAEYKMVARTVDGEWCASEDEVDRLKAQLAEAKKALEPFAHTLERYSGFTEYALFGVWEDVNGAAGRKLNILRKQNFDDAATVLAKLTKAD